MMRMQMLAIPVVATVAFLATRAVLDRGASQPASESTRGSSKPTSETSPRFTPKRSPRIERRTLAATPTFEQQTVLKEGTRAAYTWSTIARAEADLRRSRQLALARQERLLSDCFENSSYSASAFDYTLTVKTTRTSVTVGSFEIESALPRDISDCLTEALAGEATIELPAGTPEAEQFIELEQRISRHDSYLAVEAEARASLGRAALLEQVSEADPQQLAPEELALERDLGLTMEEFREKRLQQREAKSEAVKEARTPARGDQGL